MLRAADGVADGVQTPPTRSVITQVIAYVTALQQIGHILSRHQTSREPMVRERRAWERARHNAAAETPHADTLRGDVRRIIVRHPTAGDSPMLPASDLAEILTNLSALKLQPNTAAQILAAVLAPLTRADRSSEATDPSPKRAARSRRRSRGRSWRRPRAAPRRRKYKRRAARPTGARARAIAALQANPDATLARIAKLAKCGSGTVVNARKELAAEARRKPRETMPSTPIGSAKTDRRQRAQQFLKEELARGPKKVTDVEEAAARAHLDVHVLEQARADLGVVTSRGNAGGVQAVQWSLPG